MKETFKSQVLGCCELSSSIVKISMLKMESRPVGRLFGKLRQWCTIQRRRMRARNNAVASYEDSRWRLHGTEYSSCHRGLRNATLRIGRESSNNNDDDDDDDNVTASAMERGHMVFGTFHRPLSFAIFWKKIVQINFKDGQAKESKRASLYKNEMSRRDLRYDAFNFFFFPKCSTTCGPGKKTRTATCVTHGPPCDLEAKPVTQDACDLGSCVTKSTQTNAISTRLQTPQWLYTEWSEGVGTILLAKDQKLFDTDYKVFKILGYFIIHVSLFLYLPEFDRLE